MSIHTYLQRLCKTLSPRRSPQRPGKALRLELEALESRLVPTVVVHYNPAFGPEHATTYTAGDVLHNPQINLIFWGSYWKNPVNSPTQNDIFNKVVSVVSSPYASRLTDYRADPPGPGNYNIQAINALSDSPDPIDGMFSLGDVTNVVTNLTDHDCLPDPDSLSNLPIYVVITPPGVHSNQPGLLGEHFWTATGNLFDLDYAPMMWCGINTFSAATNYQDGFSDTFSHELAETLSDPNPNNPGTTVTAGPNYPAGDSLVEICDAEAQSYGYRLNNALVQSYWLQSSQAFVVPDGNAQNFYLTPQWDSANKNFLGTYVLTVQGDQLGASFNDSIALDVTSSGGVTVQLNGEKATFDPGVISSIVVNGGGGNDTLRIDATPRLVPVTVHLGKGVDNVNLTPTAQQLQAIGGSVTIEGGGGTATLTLNDQNDSLAGQQFDLTATGMTMTGPGPAVTYHGLSSVVLNGGSGAMAYFVDSTSAALTINTGKSRNLVTVCQNAEDLDALAGALTISGSGADTLVVNDQLNRDVFYGGYGVSPYLLSLTSSTITRTAEAPLYPGSTFAIYHSASITYWNIGFLTVNSATQPYALLNLESTAAGTTVNVTAGDGNNLIQVSPTAQNLNTLAGLMTIKGGNGSNALTVHDELNPYATSADNIYQISSSTVARRHAQTLGPYFFDRTRPITYYNNIGSLTINGGSRGNQFWVSSTPLVTPVTLNAGSGNDTIALFSLPYSLTVHGQGGSNTLDYSAFTQTVIVNLKMSSASGLTRFDGIQNVTGGAGDDILVGDDNNNVLNGGGGHNLLIGGRGADVLQSAGTGDILIGGYTSYDTNPTALNAVFAGWRNPSADYATRVSLLRTAPGGIYSYPLNAMTVFNDGATDTLIGSTTALDWFFALEWEDAIYNRHSGEFIN
jgi:Ca2+-binding RTX toxin-like protein